jgi:hypothetical protein
MFSSKILPAVPQHFAERIRQAFKLFFPFEFAKQDLATIPWSE